MQLAVNAGAEAVGGSLPRYFEYVSSLDTHPVNAQAANLSDQIRRWAPNGVDSIYDMYGGSNGLDSFDYLSDKSSARVLSLADDGIREAGGKNICLRALTPTLSKNWQNW